MKKNRDKIYSLKELISGRPMWSENEVENNETFKLTVNTINGIFSFSAIAEGHIYPKKMLEIVELKDGFFSDELTGITKVERIIRVKQII